MKCRGTFGMPGMKQALVAILIMAAAGSTSAQTTAFFELVRKGTPQEVRAAISKGADVNTRDNDGWTPLMAAADYNPNPEVITMLLQAGANGKEKDRSGKTALDYANDNQKLKGTDAYWKLNEALF